MKWLVQMLTSSIGQKLIMSLTGLFLIIFLVVHLAGNLQLLIDDQGETFNKYAREMTTNPLIKTVSYGLYFFILLHTVQGIVLYFRNRAARGGKGYAVRARNETSWPSRYMALLGSIIFLFLVIHMGQFWAQMHWGNLPRLSYEGYPHVVKDLYTPVALVFNQWWFVVLYLVSLLALSFHLWHGFQSAFQTLGINHYKYTPIIQGLGKLYSIVIPLGFAIIPLYFYFFIDAPVK